MSTYLPSLSKTGVIHTIPVYFLANYRHNINFTDSGTITYSTSRGSGSFEVSKQQRYPVGDSQVLVLIKLCTSDGYYLHIFVHLVICRVQIAFI